LENNSDGERAIIGVHFRILSEIFLPKWLFGKVLIKASCLENIGEYIFGFDFKWVEINKVDWKTGNLPLIVEMAKGIEF